MQIPPQSSPSQTRIALKQPASGKLVRELRQLTALSQEQFAALLGVAYSTINRWENGHVQPSLLALKQIKALLEEIHRSSSGEKQEYSQLLLQQYFPVRTQNHEV
ncbi:helix-turn-helix transcriptional regulator [Leptolyngbya sp. FACHB-541]|uniref:helix-turn-helix domain-containing protein n=1 Tax=Leptolyngbya sp. FACHB-541 TaxID=2692810 RepID=UPI001685C1BD|nr:helix-turn-helix transcriptional regulator [Leptolyngbya sp. FACHB-541]MBD1995134.1 helix-turn-helix transcriptional regulator [Leptolyngbya sp. FACHB-541]